MSNKATLIKAVVLGHGGAGKSSLMNRFVNNEFDATSYRTIGVEFVHKQLEIEGGSYSLQIWDTAGQERFRSLRVPFYRGADVCLLVFAIDNEQSFANLSLWREEFLHYADCDSPENFPFVVLGNKADLDCSREVSREEAQAWCDANGALQFFETSAKEAVNVDQAFIYAARQAVLREERKDSGEVRNEFSDTVDLNEKRKGEGGGGCCG